MPICNWCGIDSKNAQVCDWCKRPLNLRSMRTGDAGRQAVDILAEDDGSQANHLPKLIAAGGAILFLGLGGLFFVLNSAAKAPPAPEVSQAVVSKDEFLDNKPQTPVAQPVNFASPPRVFVPSPNLQETHTLNLDRDTKPAFVVRKIDLDEPTVKFGMSGAKLAAVKQPDGKIVCVGKVTIFNKSYDNIVDFKLSWTSGNKTYNVRPYIGTATDPEWMTNRVVHSKEKLTVPVMVTDYKGPVGKLKGTVKMTATIDSTAQPIKDTVSLSD